MRATKALLALGNIAALCACEAAPARNAVTFAPPASTAGANNGPSNVLVVNGASQPVPTTAVGTASVNVANSPTVNAAQSGTWNVGITGTPDVSASLASVQAGVNLPVTVSNASLAVTGTVGIDGTPTVNAAQSGTWSVGITGTPSVNASLAAGSSVGIPTHLGRKPSELIRLGSCANGNLTSLNYCPSDAYVVPSGKALVLTDLTFYASPITAGFTISLNVYDFLPPPAGFAYGNSLYGGFAAANSGGAVISESHLTGGAVVHAGKSVYVEQYYNAVSLQAFGYLTDDI